MNEGLIPRRYAKALYKVALERGDAELLYAVMNGLFVASQAQPALRDAVANPFVSVDDKLALILTASGDASGNATLNDFLKLLARNKRLDMVFAIARDYAAIFRAERNIHKVGIVSAAPLSADEKSRLEHIIDGTLNGGSAEYSFNVDPALIGGFTVTVDNQRLDASLSNELRQLRVNLIK